MSHRPLSAVVVVTALSALCAAVGLGGCNRRVFERVEAVCGPTAVQDFELDDQRTDILVVVDNSGSMQEEQDEIAKNFLNDDLAACPIPVTALGDFARCDDDADGADGADGAAGAAGAGAGRPEVCRFHNPSETQLAGELAGCGFLQVLAAFDTDFRVGVITTDVGACDNRVPLQQAGADWGFRPQRGCLQPDAPFGVHKVIARDDVASDDPALRDLGGRFQSTLANIRTFGSPVERGLDAVDLFFDDATARHESCAGDKEAFLRDDARLVIIFLTDEEDCSRLDAGPFACADDDVSCVDRFAEFADDACGENETHFERSLETNCYEHLDELTPVSVYADRFRRLKADPADVSVAVIAGGVRGADGALIASGCVVDDAGQPAGGCEPLAGRTRFECPDCCIAEGGGRYLALADEAGGIKDSICFESFRDTMIEIAAFLGAVDVVRFAEQPTNAALIVVEKNDVHVERLAGPACGDDDGWVLLDARSLQLCGNARPAAGDTFKVRAALPGLCP